MITEITESVDLRGDNTLIEGTFNQINFVMADETKIITRIYGKISHTFSEIGGLANILILLSKIILYFWTENNILIYLISTILPIEEKKKFFAKNNQDIYFNNLPRSKSFLYIPKLSKKTLAKSKENEKNLKDNSNDYILENKNKNHLNNNNNNNLKNQNLSNQDNLNRENIIPNFRKNLELNKKRSSQRQSSLRLKMENCPKIDENEENKPKYSKEKNHKFHFFNKLCIWACLPKKKKKFLSLSKNIIYKKLSMENILEMTIKLQIIKNYLFDEEQNKKLENLPEFNLLEHLNECYNIQ